MRSTLTKKNIAAAKTHLGIRAILEYPPEVAVHCHGNRYRVTEAGGLEHGATADDILLRLYQRAPYALSGRDIDYACSIPPVRSLR